MSYRTEIPTPLIIRRLSDQVCPNDSSLEAFCIDHFPHVHRLFSSGMDRTAKLNILLVHVSHSELHKYLIIRMQSATNESANHFLSASDRNNVNVKLPYWGKLIIVLFFLLVPIILLAVYARIPRIITQNPHDLSIRELADVTMAQLPDLAKPKEMDTSKPKPHKRSVLFNCGVQTHIREKLKNYLGNCIKEIQLVEHSSSKKALSLKLVRLGHYQLSSPQDNVFDTGISVCIKGIEPSNEDPPEIEIKCKAAN